MTVTHVPSEGDVYAIWRIDLTPAGRKERARLEGQVDPIPFPDYPVLQQTEMCLHDPLYRAGKWRCVLREGHSEFHRYMPELEQKSLQRVATHTKLSHCPG